MAMWPLIHKTLHEKRTGQERKVKRKIWKKTRTLKKLFNKITVKLLRNFVNKCLF